MHSQRGTGFTWLQLRLIWYLCPRPFSTIGLSLSWLTPSSSPSNGPKFSCLTPAEKQTESPCFPPLLTFAALLIVVPCTQNCTFCLNCRQSLPASPAWRCRGRRVLVCPASLQLGLSKVTEMPPSRGTSLCEWCWGRPWHRYQGQQVCVGKGVPSGQTSTRGAQWWKP